MPAEAVRMKMQANETNTRSCTRMKSRGLLEEHALDAPSRCTVETTRSVLVTLPNTPPPATSWLHAPLAAVTRAGEAAPPDSAGEAVLEAAVLNPTVRHCEATPCHDMA
jgi:hypothetical protein